MNRSLLLKLVTILVGILMNTNQSVCAASANSITVTPFGKTSSGREVDLYTLENKQGMKVSIMTYGATVVDVIVPDRNGNLGDVSLGFDTFQPYLTKSPYFGAIVGRYGNRIANGRFTLDGKTYQLATNDGPNHLHGGVKGFDKRLWTAEIVRSSSNSVRFTLVSPNGQEGYPGTLHLAVTYTLTDDNALKISYEATTDAPTIVNVTNHTYFNLAGAGNGSILGHELKLGAAHFTPVNSVLIPTGEIKSVKGTPMDFRKPELIGKRIKEVGGNPIGYDHNWVLDKKLLPGLKSAAEVYEPRPAGSWKS